MEYYAKSKEKFLSEDERKRLKTRLKALQETLNIELELWETVIIDKAVERVDGVKEVVQKKLKEHEKDIVNCANQFFEQYGRYFTSKERKLVILACKIHDFGKTNLIFQILVNICLKEKVDPKLWKVEQIPHGFLSGLSISEEEFLSLNLTLICIPVLSLAIFFKHTPLTLIIPAFFPSCSIFH